MIDAIKDKYGTFFLIKSDKEKVIGFFNLENWELNSSISEKKSENRNAGVFYVLNETSIGQCTL